MNANGSCLPDSSLSKRTRSRKKISLHMRSVQATSENSSLLSRAVQVSHVSQIEHVKSFSEKRLLHGFAWDSKAATLCARIVGTQQEGFRGVCFLRQGAHQLIVGDLHLQKRSTEQHQLMMQRGKSTAKCSLHVSSTGGWEYVELLSFYNYFQEREEFRILAIKHNFPSTITSGFMAELLQCTLQFLCASKVITSQTIVYLKASGVVLQNSTTKPTTDAPATYIPLVAYYSKLGFCERFPGLIERYAACCGTQEYRANPMGVKKQLSQQQRDLMHGLNNEALCAFYNTTYVNLSGVEMHANVQSITNAWGNRICRFIFSMLKPVAICAELNEYAYEVEASNSF
jgi:hypothetical protein